MDFIQRCQLAESFQLFAFSTYQQKELEHVDLEDVAINRYYFPYSSKRKLYRLFFYLVFNIRVLISLFKLRPTYVMYFETISAFPALLYKICRPTKSKLFIHYHEYIPPDQYQRGMILERFYHKLERKMIKSASWISHTNLDRLGLFCRDHDLRIDDQTLRILPNYPPSSWINKSPTLPFQPVKDTLRMVYIGSLSTEGMYLNEIIHWIKKQKGRVSLDVYSFNATEKLKAKLSQCPYLKLSPGIDYHRIPKILQNYRVGLILYKATSPNVIYSAPNKLFEYLACGLDVWCSDKLISSAPFQRQYVSPKVLLVDFEKLDEFNWRKSLSNKELPFVPSEFTCDQVLHSLVEEFK
ncbi:MAG: glycosyltransferase family 4 protein [Cyanothece sp. SIO1E1]|nr:glycosyltransferase family 4 protein [Cyanothece sp. SIO1E1]